VELIDGRLDVGRAVGGRLHQEQDLLVVLDAAPPAIRAADRQLLDARRLPAFDEGVGEARRLLVRTAGDLDLDTLHRSIVAPVVGRSHP